MKRRRRLSFLSIISMLLALGVLVGLFTFFRDGGSKDRTFKAADMIGALFESIKKQEPENVSEPGVAVAQQTTAKVKASVKARPSVVPSAKSQDVSGPAIPVNITLGGNLNLSSVKLSSDKQSVFVEGLLSNIKSKIIGDINILTGENLEGVSQNFINSLSKHGVNGVFVIQPELLDRGIDAFKTKEDIYDKAGMVGLKSSVGDAELVQVNGLKIGLLQSIDSLTAAGERQEQKAGIKVNRLETKTFKMRLLKAVKDSDILILCVYDNKAKSAQGRASIEKQLMEIAESGVDIIILNGSETLQRAEVYRYQNKEGKLKESLIIYGLGNLFTQKRGSIKGISSALLHLSITKSQGKDDLRFISLGYTPSYLWQKKDSGKTTIRLLNSSKLPSEDMNKIQQRQMKQSLIMIDRLMQPCGFKRPLD